MSDQAETVTKKRNSNGLAAIIIGVVSFLLWTTIPGIGLFTSIAALTLGIASLVMREANKPLAIIGVVLGGIGALVSSAALIVGFLSGVVGDTLPSYSSSETSDSTATAPMPKIGTPVSDGSLMFTVNSLECGIKTVGTEYMNTTAQGQFCKVGLTVENTGKEPARMFSSAQKAFDTQGREFADDSTPAIYDQTSSSIWMEEINPGNAVTGNIYFDIPDGAVLDRIQLHESIYSDGVSVSLK